MDEAEENSAEDQPRDELGQVLVDAQRDSETLKESKKFWDNVGWSQKIVIPKLQAGA